MRKLPPLSALPAFEATVRLGSVNAAARELGRTHGAISKQLQHLAEDIGGGLFEKDGTGIRPTERGLRLGHVASTAL
ncbi:MAG: LysR family transcriptional regulator, partial [Pseudomonadota bacterium]